MGYPEYQGRRGAYPKPDAAQAGEQPDIAGIVRGEIAQALRPVEQALRTNLENLQTLTGERGDGDGRAITRGDLGALTLTAVNVAAAPTAAEYNALVADMRAIAGLLARLGAETNV
jgi:hypothetical protein